ncbi:putative aminotransferase [Janibacter sp. HTCC2649]|nr:putative aminotransferase [Janibacter sp. HTCC2649]
MRCPRSTHGKVADGPAEPAEDGQDERPHRRDVAALRAHDGEPAHRDEDAEPAPG